MVIPVTSFGPSLWAGIGPPATLSYNDPTVSGVGRDALGT